MKRSDAGISWVDKAKLADLDFADDIALPEESVYSMPILIPQWVLPNRMIHVVGEMPSF